VPLNGDQGYDATKTFALAVAEGLERQAPGDVVSRMQKALRAGKVLVDWSQNDEHKTTVSVWSLRAQPEPTASTPVAPDELERAVELGDPGRLRFTADAAAGRFERDGDGFAEALRLRQTLPALA
jgi:bifunctional non-homologous end joining protein LigD